MALEMFPDVHSGTGAIDLVTIDRHLYLTEDRTRVVEEGDVDGRWLWSAPGQQVPRADAERLGAIPDIGADAGPEPLTPAESDEDEPDTKQRKAPPNKARGKAEDK